MRTEDRVPSVIEADPAVLAQVPFGRNRFLAALGGTLFGYVTGMVVRSQPAEAAHQDPLWPCEGFGRCHYCDGSICYRYCFWPGGSHSHCPSGGQYWETCTSAGTRYRCRDWHEDFNGAGSFHHCICGTALGRC